MDYEVRTNKEARGGMTVAVAGTTARHRTQARQRSFTMAYANRKRVGRWLGVVTVLTFSHFTASTTHAQTFNWATRAGGPAPSTSYQGDTFTAVAVDDEGNSYVTGSFTGTATFGAGEANETQLTAAGRDAVVAKYARDGRLLWVRQAGDSTPADGDEAFGVAVDASGNAYVTGFVSAPGAVFGFGQNNVTALTDSGTFLAKYSGDGTLLWAKRVVAGRGKRVALDEHGNIYLITRECFLARFDPSGTLTWSQQVGSTVFIQCNDLAVDEQQNSYIAGGFIGEATFDQTHLRARSVDYDIFLAKFSADGHVSFAVPAGGTWMDSALGVAVDRSGNSYVTGYFNDTAVFGTGARQTSLTATPRPNGIGKDLFLAKYASDGNLVWVRQAGSGNGLGSDIAVDEAGLVYVVASSHEAEMTFGPGQATGGRAAGAGGYLATYTSDGLFLAVDTMVGRWATPSGIALDGHRGVYVSGYFDLAVTFDWGNPSELTFTTAGGDDMFLARYTADLRLRVEIVNEQLRFAVQSTSFDPTPVAGGSAGVFTITAMLSNPGAGHLFTPVRAIVHTLNGGNILLSATEGDGTTGSKQEIDVGEDNALAPGESIPVVFRIGLASRHGFTFLVDVEGADAIERFSSD
jgi:hypothetical protein